MTSNTPEATPLLILFGLFILMLMFGSFLAWVAAFSWLRMGGRSIPVEPRQPAPWGLIHFVGIFVLFVLIGAVTIRFCDALLFGPMITQQPADMQEGLQTMSRMFAGSLSQIITMVVASLMIVYTTRATTADLGWTVRHIGYDIIVGLGAAILFLPIIQLIMASLVYLLDQKYDHPLLEALQSGPALWMYLGAFFAAVIAAPITEEFLFRVILQGMLEANATSFTWKRLLFGNMLDGPTQDAQAFHISSAKDNTAHDKLNSAESPSPPEGMPSSVSEAFATVQKEIHHKTLPPSPYLTPADSTTSAESHFQNRLPIWPLFVSGTLFGLAHAEYGPSWIPLILMGIVLGYLYRCTHRIWACWIVHISLNAISMIGFGLQILSGNPLAHYFQWLGL